MDQTNQTTYPAWQQSPGWLIGKPSAEQTNFMAHPHHHHPAPVSHNRAFALGVGLNLAFVVVEVMYGVLADSLALIADAGHNLSDVISLLLAWGAAWLASLTPTLRRSYGYRRATILASLISAMLLMGALGGIAWEAMQRFEQPQAVDGKIVILVALIGVAINTLTALLFLRGQHHDLNIRGAFLHLAADALVSLGVVVAGVVILYTGWLWLDPALSLLIVLLVVIGSWELLRDSLNLVLDTVPRQIDPQAVAAYLRKLPGVTDIHDLHIWAMSTTEVALTVHLTMPGEAGNDRFLHQLAHDLRDRFGIAHPTVQIEREADDECRLSHPESL